MNEKKYTGRTSDATVMQAEITRPSRPYVAPALIKRERLSQITAISSSSGISSDT